MTRLFAASSPPQPKLPKMMVRPVRIHVPDRELHTNIVRGVGFRASASDGWHGPKRRTYREARDDANEHRRAQS